MISNDYKEANRYSFARTILPVAFAISLSFPFTSFADPSAIGTAPLKPDVPYVFVVHQGRSIKVSRNIANSFRAGIDIRSELMQTSGSCPPFCLQPIALDLPVKTVAEAEIIDFMLTELRDNKGVLVDIRSAKQYKYNTIPGSINLFIQDLMKAAESNEMDKIFEDLGAKRRETPGWFMQQLETFGLAGNELLTAEWDFTGAKDLIVWSTGATEPTPAKFIDILLSAGYPASKIKWYRGGMAAWQYWGFTTVRAPKR